MDSERWKQIDNLLQAALERPPTDRGDFLRQACAGDEELEREVRSLLAVEPPAGGFLEDPAMEVAARNLARQHIALQRSGLPQSEEISGSLVGQTVSHYRIVEKLGAGGMGVVWKARDTRLDRFVALKFLPAEKLSDPERKRRFIQEAKSASALNHPNIITVYDIGQTGPECGQIDFIAMEWVDGKTLGELIGRKGLKLNEALKYAVEIADALAKAHAAGIVHRDLKPGNVMVTAEGRVKVLDFGLAKLTEAASLSPEDPTLTGPQSTEMGMIVGTISYMSPEQAEGKKLDARSDIFSFGSLLYEMLTGRRAFQRSSQALTLAAILQQEPVPLHAECPRELERVVARCLRKDPARRFQTMADLKVALEELKEESDSGKLAASPAGGRKRVSPRLLGGIAAAGAVVCIASLALGWRLHNSPAAPLPWKLTQITSDPGQSTAPAISRDGKLVAYASDRGPEGGLDLYVQQAAGGQTIRLTFDGSDNTTPDFSPDGSRIVFGSRRDGLGIYEIPAFGGEVRLLARDGRYPRFSPDGSQVAYWVGAPGVGAWVPESGAVWVVPAAGGTPRRVGSKLAAARYPIWSPDGKHLLFIGYDSAKAYDRSALDWWLVVVNENQAGSQAVRTGAYDALVRAGLEDRDLGSNSLSKVQYPTLPWPSCWRAAAGSVVFSAQSGDTANLWEIGLSLETGKVTEAPRRLTAGAGHEVGPSCASGDEFAFADTISRKTVWSQPFDLNRGESKGPLERIGQGSANLESPSLSSDGRYVAFPSDQSGPTNIWLRELATGKESHVASSQFLQRYPVIGATGGRVAFGSYENGKRVEYVTTPGGAPEKLCEGCLRATDWSGDEKALLIFEGSPMQIDLLDVASHRQTALVKHPTYNLLYGRFSPDNRWVSFTARTQPGHGQIMVAPADGARPVPPSAWIKIAEERDEDWASWSPDGKTLYFTSPRGGRDAVWGQRIDSITHRPVGDAFEAVRFPARAPYRQGGWSAAGGRIAASLIEETGNVWMMSRSGAR